MADACFRRDPHDPTTFDDASLLVRALSTGRAMSKKGAQLGGGRVRRIAERMLARGSLLHWAKLDPRACAAEVREHAGAGDDAGRVAALFELARRAVGPPAGIELARAEDVVACLGEWRSAKREHFVGFYLNARNQLLSRSLISLGSLSASIVHPREVFQPAIVLSAAGLIVAHNHPSGDPEPSPEDLSVTRRLVEAGELLGIELLDHIVIADRGFVSLKARGRL